MPTDQPENPRIRTKVLSLDADVDHRYYEILEQLRLGQLDVPAFQRATLAFFERLGMIDFFADDIAIAERADDQHWLVRRHTDHCRYTVLFFRVDPGEVHPELAGAGPDWRRVPGPLGHCSPSFNQGHVP